MLSDSEADSNEHIFSWMPNGTSFRIHRRDEFIAKILPKYYHRVQIRSFMRQLNLYGFNRIDKKMMSKNFGAYSHDLFVRDNPALCAGMVRKKAQKCRTEFKNSTPRSKPASRFEAEPIASDWPGHDDVRSTEDGLQRTLSTSAWRNANSSRVLGSDEYLPSSDDGDTSTIAQGCIRQCGQDGPRQQGNGGVVGRQNYDYHLILDMLLPAKSFAHQHATFLPDRGAHCDPQEGNQKQQIRDHHAMVVELLQQLEPTPLPEERGFVFFHEEAQY
jgi:hypothetical protein